MLLSKTNESKRKKKPWFDFVIILALVLAVTGVVVFVVSYDDSHVPELDQSRFSIDYKVAVNDTNVKILDVYVDLGIESLSSEGLIYLYRNEVDTDILRCVDDLGNTVDMNDTGNFQLIAIGPIDPSASFVSLFYNVRIGNQNYMDAAARTYGDMYEDLLVFCGENVLIGPLFDLTDLKSVEDFISSVSFKLDANYGWNAIIPYQEHLSDDCSFIVENPTWTVFNSIIKSTFCFGQFEKMDSVTGLTVYLDKAIAGNISDRSLEVFYAFTRYYTDLFGELPPDAPFVLLRNAAEDHSMILGGVGAKGGALSADINLGDECQTMTTTLFHLYFDSLIKAPNLRYVPNNWIYQGLSNYCVDNSADYLSEEIKEAFSIEGDIGDIGINYLKYLYFSLKEPGFLIVDPSMEGNMLEAQNVYYMNIKVPLMIDFIDKVISENSGKSFIQALLEEAGQEETFDVNDFIKKTCGSDYEGILKAFSGNVIIPNYDDLNIDDKISSEDVVDILLSEEEYFSYLFEADNIFYEYPPLLLLDQEKFFAEIESMDVRYNTDEVQNEVKAFSSTLHQLLMEYALIAKFAGVNDITVPKASSGIFTSESYERFMEFCESLGYEFNYDD
ncbi:MAG: hypothetical protein FWH57_09685 [Oscillospiraceae bacterium]|nr:hypothetical protein [Oscillospiraceae bacterium]